MSNSNLCKEKHLRIEDRLIIEYGLDQNYSLKEIAEKLKKDPTTISKEIKRNKCRKTSKFKEHDIKQCSKLSRYPYVCNGCSKVTTCTTEKSYY